MYSVHYENCNVRVRVSLQIQYVQMFLLSLYVRYTYCTTYAVSVCIPIIRDCELMLYFFVNYALFFTELCFKMLYFWPRCFILKVCKFKTRVKFEQSRHDRNNQIVQAAPGGTERTFPPQNTNDF